MRRIDAGFAGLFRAGGVVPAALPSEGSERIRDGRPLVRSRFYVRSDIGQEPARTSGYGRESSIHSIAPRSRKNATVLPFG